MHLFESAENESSMISHETQVALGLASDLPPELVGGFSMTADLTTIERSLSILGDTDVRE
jgi:hypothetical protein